MSNGISLAQPRSALGLIGAVTTLVLDYALVVLLFMAGTADATDALPRPLVIGAFYLVPAIVSLLGWYGRRRSLLVAAALALIPSAFLSWALVTLPFLVPAVMLILGAALAPPSRPAGGGAFAWWSAFGVTALTLVGGWVVLFGLVEPHCVAIPGGQACSSAALTPTGLGVGGALLVGALAIAAWSAFRRS